MKILLSVTGLGVGGAERLVTDLADYYVASGHEVMLVAFHGVNRLLPNDARVQVRNLGMRRHPVGVLLAMWRFRRLVIEFKPDVVNSHLIHANIITRLLRILTPMPFLVSSAHNPNEEGRGRMLAYRLTDSLADISTNVSADAVRAFEQQGALSKGRMVAIHNGIDTKKFSFDQAARRRIRVELSIGQTATIILAVGRLWKPKDYPTLLQAFARLVYAESDFQLIVVGDGPLLGDLEALAASLGLSERVRFLGVRHDIPEIMSACDIFVLSSAWEGFGLVVAEAMACERPVVATDCGGVREVVGNAGFLVPPGDYKALSSALRDALAMSASEKASLGSLARCRVNEYFSLKVTAKSYLSVYKNKRSAR